MSTLIEKMVVLLLCLELLAVPFCHSGEYSVNTNESFAFPLQTGWPIEFNGQLKSSCVITDIENDGNKEIAFCYNYYVKILNNLGSSINPSWPMHIGKAPPSFYDIDRDGQMEIVIGSIDLRIHESDGSLFPGWPYILRDESEDPYIYSSPAVSCLDEFSQPVVVSGVYALNKVFIWNMFGQPLLNWPKATSYSSAYSAALVDIDRDGHYEVAFPFKSGPSFDGGGIQIFHSDGTIVDNIWDVDFLNNYGLHNNVQSDLTVGDVDGDTYPEIMVGVSFGALVLNHDTTIATGFPKDTHSNVYGGLTCGDIDGDDKLEIACVTSGDYDDHNIYLSRLYIWNGEDGTNLENWPVDIIGVDCLGQSVIIGDIDGDCDRELVVSGFDDFSRGVVYAFHHTGDIVDGFPLIIDGFISLWSNSCFITDIDNDGDVEIGVGLNDNSSYSRVYIWDLPYPYHEECQDWPQYNHDAQHTGNFHYKPIVPQVALPTLTPWAILLLVLLLSPVLVRQR